MSSKKDAVFAIISMVLALIGDRYGCRPPAAAIEENEFDRVADFIDDPSAAAFVRSSWILGAERRAEFVRWARIGFSPTSDGGRQNVCGGTRWTIDDIRTPHI